MKVTSIKHILPFLLTQISRKPRYLVRPNVNFEWNSKCWTHNIFRFYEMVFGRRYGIRPEMTTNWSENEVTHACHSFESFLALTESKIREALRLKSIKGLIPVRVHIPVLKTPEGFPVFQSPYVFAIAFDAAKATGNDAVSSGSLTFDQTCTGSDLLLWVLSGQRNADQVTAVSYNSVSATQTGGSINPPTRTTWGSQLWYLIDPDTGTNTVSIGSISTADLRGSSASYSGCQQSGVPDQSTTATGTTSPISATLTLGTDSWAILAPTSDAVTPAASTNSTLRTTNVGITSIFDSNGANTGSFNMQATVSSGNWCTFMASFLPAGGGTTFTPRVMIY